MLGKIIFDAGCTDFRQLHWDKIQNCSIGLEEAKRVCKSHRHCHYANLSRENKDKMMQWILWVCVGSLLSPFQQVNPISSLHIIERVINPRRVIFITT